MVFPFKSSFKVDFLEETCQFIQENPLHVYINDFTQIYQDQISKNMPYITCLLLQIPKK